MTLLRGDTPATIVAVDPGGRLTSRIDQSVNTPHPARAGGEFFTAPTAGPHRRYEALRAYLLDGQPAADVAARFGYTTAGLHSAVADFRAGSRDFFTDSRPGPKTAPGKDAARARILELRPRTTPSTRSPRC